jgi:hypothetical protein
VGELGVTLMVLAPADYPQLRMQIDEENVGPLALGR